MILDKQNLYTFSKSCQAATLQVLVLPFSCLVT